MTSYEEAVSYILDIPRFAGKTGLENLNKYMAYLGNPERGLRIVHIAGTNGKGSVTEMLSSILREAGLHVGTFISPHLERINERISVDGIHISDEDFVMAFDKVMEVYKEHKEDGLAHLSFFEYLFAMAMVYFDEKSLDYVILETGLGGRLDATNMVSPVLNIITSIGMDHMQYLGDTLEKIAGEKAGIITSNVPVVFNTGSDIADDIIIGKCEIKDVDTFIDAGDTYVEIIKADSQKIDFSLDNSYYKYYNLRLRTPALYQIKNAESAIMAAHLLLKKLDKKTLAEAVYRGIYNFKWAARMEYLSDNLIIDGAHNEDAAKVFVETANNIFEKGNWRKKMILFAVSADKDYDSVIKIISEEFDPDKVYITKFDSDRTLDTTALRETFEKHFSKYDITVFETLDEAVEMLKSIPEDEVVFAVGSLYLAGELREKMELAKG